MRLCFFALLLSVAGCHAPKAGGGASTEPSSGAGHKKSDVQPLVLLDQLEVAIDERAVGKSERRGVYQKALKAPDDGTTEWAFGLAGLAGRLAEARGLGAGKLVTKAEEWALLSVKRDPEFRLKVATRMLGTLYVMAPGRLVKHGDSEEGLEILLKLEKDSPLDPRNQLRMAEAYIYFGDEDLAGPHLCGAQKLQAELRTSEKALLQRLIAEYQESEDLQCSSEH